VVYFQVFVTFSRTSTLARARCVDASARGRIILIALFVQGAGFDGRARREGFQLSHLRFEGVHALLEFGDESTVLFVSCLILF
jgi:hypothetical protein